LRGDQEPTDRHGWNRLDSYRDIMARVLRNHEWFIESDDLDLAHVDGTLQISGHLTCSSGRLLGVWKRLLVQSRDGVLYVRTIRYSYEAFYAGRCLFRYDNAHPHPGHPDEHHKHVFDASGGEQVIWLGRDRWPYLSDALEELAQWSAASL